MDKTAFGDRMKGYEAVEAGRRFTAMLPILARIDGRSFSRFTRAMDRPFDRRFSELMVGVTTRLVKETNALVGYTQSDEISLLFYSDFPKKQIFFDGRIQKMTSVLAAMTSVFFYRGVVDTMPEYAKRMPMFDARVWSVPNAVEATNTLLWRERDAIKNSVSMLARSRFSHKSLMGRSTNEQLDLLKDEGVDWNQLPDHFRRGTFIRRKVTRSKFTVEEFASLPPQHNAHKDPDLMVERSVLERLDVPTFGDLGNRVEVLFEGAEPEVRN